MNGLPAGRYVAVAQPTLIEGLVNEPDDLEQLEAVGTRLTVTDGQQSSLILRLD
jgi:hypothetical protein